MVILETRPGVSEERAKFLSAFQVQHSIRHGGGHVVEAVP